MVCEERGKFVGWYRPADQINLNLIAVVRPQKRLLLGGFHPLGHDGEIERTKRLGSPVSSSWGQKLCARLGAALFGHIVKSGHEAAIGHWSMRDRDNVPIGQSGAD